MPKKERWGRPYIDDRDWSIYSEQLVKRGEFYLCHDFIDQCDDELVQMNAGKPGRPFQYPESVIAWMARISTFLQMPYHQMEGFVQELATFIPDLQAANYTTLFVGSNPWSFRSKEHPESNRQVSYAAQQRLQPGRQTTAVQGSIPARPPHQPHDQV